MANIYVVTSGEYSDYRIIAVFDSEFLAQVMADHHNTAVKSRWGDQYEVETFTLNPGESNYHEGLSRRAIVMRRDGSVVRMDDHGPFVEGDPEDRFYKMYAGNAFEKATLHTYVWAKSEEHAIKVANERRAQHIASGEWDRQDAK
jgi:hypothetical protein